MSGRAVLTLTLCAAALAIAATALSCGPPSRAGKTVPGVGGSPTTDATAASFFNAFGPTSFPTFAEAEAKVGYHIPRPSAEFPLRWGDTDLRRFRSVTTSQTLYKYPALPESDLSLDVFPASEYPWTPAALSVGVQRTIGPWSGWLDLRDTHKYTFSFKCGAMGQTEIWCTANASPELPQAVFEQFVSSIR